MKKTRLSERDKDFLFVATVLALVAALGALLAFEMGWL